MRKKTWTGLVIVAMVALGCSGDDETEEVGETAETENSEAASTQEVQCPEPVVEVIEVEICSCPPEEEAAAIGEPDFDDLRAVPTAIEEGDQRRVGGGGTEYTIASGDSLWQIAIDQLGNGSRWEEIYEANRETIGADPLSLTVGTEIRIPAR